MTLQTLSREAWLDLRQQSIGASEAAAACGESPYLSPLELYARKVGRISDPDLSDVEHVRWGNLLEPAIVSETCTRLKLRLLPIEEAAERLADKPEVEILGAVEGRQLFMRSRLNAHMTATLDGVAVDRTGELVSIEAKNAASWKAEEWESGQSPPHYQLQVAHQLAVVSSLSRGVLAGLVGGNKLQIAPAIERTAAPIAALTAIEAEFWRRVLEGRPPSADGSASSLAALKALHPDDNGASVTLPLEFAALHEERAQLQAEIKERESRLESLNICVRDALKDATFGVLPNGLGTYSLKTQQRAEHIVAASKFRVLRFSKGK